MMYILLLTVTLLSGNTEIHIGSYVDELQCVAEAGSIINSGIDKELLTCVSI